MLMDKNLKPLKENARAKNSALENWTRLFILVLHCTIILYNIVCCLFVTIYSIDKIYIMTLGPKSGFEMWSDIEYHDPGCDRDLESRSSFGMGIHGRILGSSVKIGFEVGFQDKIQRSGFGTTSGSCFETRVGVGCRAEDGVGFQGSRSI